MKNPLIFFIHVPKTAGTTVNEHVSAHFKKSVVHCESFFNQRDVAVKAVQEERFLSGHMPFPNAKRFLAKQDRIVQFYTCLREPVFQVMSHLNWLIEIYNKGFDFFYAHPEQIQLLSHKVRSNGLKTASDLMFILLSHKKLFLNNQSKHVLGEPTEDYELIKEKLRDFNYIGTESTLDVLLEKMTGKRPKTIDYANASEYHFDKSLFEKEDIRRFLEVHNASDSLLYKAAREIFG